MKTKIVGEVSEELHRRQLGEKHSKNQLLEAVEELFSIFDIGFISEHLAGLIFLAVNREPANDPDIETVATLATDQAGIIRYLSLAYVAYTDYKSSKEKLSELTDEVA